jgi:hypothetical protein
MQQVTSERAGMMALNTPLVNASAPCAAVLLLALVRCGTSDRAAVEDHDRSGFVAVAVGDIGNRIRAE